MGFFLLQHTSVKPWGSFLCLTSVTNESFFNNIIRNWIRNIEHHASDKCQQDSSGEQDIRDLWETRASEAVFESEGLDFEIVIWNPEEPGGSSLDPEIFDWNPEAIGEPGGSSLDFIRMTRNRLGNLRDRTPPSECTRDAKDAKADLKRITNPEDLLTAECTRDAKADHQPIIHTC
ncbi:hypothetical protein DY000_02016322 [Brassica cretica]|uniref:Uncharacterized protein n=1 Tax=Brassica cretica TaxID=69181 RepID=A0ABQ7CSD0_BRACR|nr:hypothetical protein DY000_02016322 [Brassica cretica]